MCAKSYRLNQGGRIDRSNSISFTWDGRAFQGFQGDTLASALLANGVGVVGRSFKYHRPRGVMSAGVEEAGAYVTVGIGDNRDPNVRATTTELYAGLSASGQNAWPNVRFDMGSVSGLFSRFFSAGFYYKTFMGLPPFEWGKGTSIWMQYEKLIRKSTGMGSMPRTADTSNYEHQNGYCDLLVVGGGVAGMAAALAVAEAGVDVVLVEQDFELGGDLLSSASHTDIAKRTELVAALERSDVRTMPRTTAFGLYDNETVGLLERVPGTLPPGSSQSVQQRMWTMRAKHIVLATGALERHFAFGNNDRPGVMSVSAARSYTNRFGVMPGRVLTVATNNDSAYQTALDLRQAGADVHLLDSRKKVDQRLQEQSKAAGINLQTGSAPMNVLGAKYIKSVEIAKHEGGAWQAAGRIDCDNVLVSGGWSPVVNLHSHRGVKPVWDTRDHCFLPGQSSENIHVIGSAAGYWDTDNCKESGQVVAVLVTAELGLKSTKRAMPVRTANSQNLEPLYEVKLRGRKLACFVDPLHDVKADDVRLAHQEGFVSVEHLKRYTTLGMASDQGRMGNVIGLALMADAIGTDIPSVGTTTFRPPYSPVPIGAFAGRSVGEHFKPIRRTPMHDWSLAQGAEMTDAGLWLRSWYFPRGQETIADAYIREAKTVRETVGMCDVTSLGKIAVQGPDAAEFLNRVYTNPFLKLPVGKARYGIMLRDDGIVMDDGTTWRLSETDYLMTTTTTNAGRVMVWLEELLQCRWPDLKVHVTSVTEQYGGFSVAGPKAREAIQAVLKNPEDLSNEHCPFMAVIDSQLNTGVICRIARISFSGELAYEIYVDSDYGTHLAEVLSREVIAREGCQYGLEALGALRIEKGHVTSAELDGRVTIFDAALGGMASKKKSYIGSTLQQRPELQREDRQVLVGVFPKDRSQTFNAGSILCSVDKVEGHGEGWISAVTYSPALGHWIGIGFISGGYNNWSELSVVAADPLDDKKICVEIVSPHMFDPDGGRMRD